MNKIRVVLIEDHDLTRIGLRMIFQQHPAIEIVGEAADGITGAKLLEAMNPDVAVVDLGLPGIDGVAVIQHYKKAYRSAATETKFMVLTLQEEPETVLAAFAAGADSYCLKDSQGDRLLEALHSTYRGDNWLDPAIARIVVDRYNHQRDATVSTSNDRQITITADQTQQALLESYPLTTRELEILGMIVQGCSNANIASGCYITVGTVKTHVCNILTKLCVDDRTQAAVRALRGGLIT